MLLNRYSTVYKKPSPPVHNLVQNVNSAMVEKYWDREPDKPVK